jgi:hypothetical protein
LILHEIPWSSFESWRKESNVFMLRNVIRSMYIIGSYTSRDMQCDACIQIVQTNAMLASMISKTNLPTSRHKRCKNGMRPHRMSLLLAYETSSDAARNAFSSCLLHHQ